MVPFKVPTLARGLAVPWGTQTTATVENLIRVEAAWELPIGRSHVDGDIHAGGQVKLLELIDRLGGGFDDVDEPLVRAGLELLHRLLVDVRGAVDREFLDASRQRNGAGNAGSGTLGGFDDVLGRLVNDPIVETLELDANSLAFHGGKRTGQVRAGALEEVSTILARSELGTCSK